MGLDYSYNIICRREQMWGVLDTAGKWAWGDFREYSARFELDERDVQRPLSDVWEAELIIEETPIRDISTDTSIWFKYDDAIRDWEKKNQYDEGEEDGRYIGNIYVYIYPFLDYEYGDEVTLLDGNDVEIKFTAATTCMSRLFEESVSIRKTFIEIAKAHEGAICALDREANNDVVVWFDGEEVWEEVGELGSSREILTWQVKENRIIRELRDLTRKMTDRHAFLQAIKSDDATVRAVAVSFLGKKNPVNFNILREMLFNDADAEVRRRCAIALAQKPDREMQLTLLKVLNDESPLVRYEVCVLIDKIPQGTQVDVTGALAPLLKDSSRDVRRASMWVFYKLARAQHIPQLIEALEVKETRPYAAKALARLQAVEAVQPLCETLKKELQQRIPHYDEIAFALGELGVQSAVPLLIEALESLHWSSCTTRFWLVQALGKLGDARAIPALEEAAKKHNCETTREAEAAIKQIKELNDIEE